MSERYIWSNTGKSRHKIHVAKDEPEAGRYEAPRARCGAIVQFPVYGDQPAEADMSICSKCFPIPAQLKLAAPELLAACEKLFKVMDSVEWDEWLQDIVDEFHAAIAKARGEV